METADIITRLKAAGVNQGRIADALGRSRTVAVQIMNGRRPLKVHEVAPLEALLADHDTAHEIEDDANRYAAVEVLPAYAGMGGGGFADDTSRETALVPRVLIEDVLRGRPSDFLLVNTRGDSMEPDFFQGDQVLVDRRDRSPTQPGPFALMVEGSFVLKNVERTGGGVRVFSTNPKYTSEMIAHDQIQVLGRPVWVGRML